MGNLKRACLVGLQLVSVVAATAAEAVANCPGYRASNIQTTKDGLSADLHLSGKSCNAYGKDLDNLRLQVVAETGEIGNDKLQHLSFILGTLLQFGHCTNKLAQRKDSMSRFTMLLSRCIKFRNMYFLDPKLPRMV